MMFLLYDDLVGQSKSCFCDASIQLRLRSRQDDYSIVWTLDELDRKLDAAYVLSLDRVRKKQVLKYAFRDRQGKYILCWDLARYVNHSFHANCNLQPTIWK